MRWAFCGWRSKPGWSWQAQWPAASLASTTASCPQLNLVRFMGVIFLAMQVTGVADHCPWIKLLTKQGLGHPQLLTRLMSKHGHLYVISLAASPGRSRACRTDWASSMTV